LADALTPSIESIRQQAYYVKPRFHASIAWALLHRPHGSIPLHPLTSVDAASSSDDLSTPPVSQASGGSGDAFPTISCLPPDVIDMLNERHAQKISSNRVGAFTVETITVKIGKEIVSWKLNGAPVS